MEEEKWGMVEWGWCVGGGGGVLIGGGFWLGFCGGVKRISTWGG